MKLTKNGDLKIGADEQKDVELLKFILSSITIVRDIDTDRITISTGIMDDPYCRFSADPNHTENEGFTTYSFVEHVT